MENTVSTIVIRLNKESNAQSVAADISREAGTLETALWEKLIPEIVQFVVLDRVAGYIFSFILFAVVAFTVLNTIQMSVFERTKEFGVLLALGTSRDTVFKMVMAESLLITSIGVGAGIVLGLGVSAFVERHPFDYSRFAAEFAVWGVYTTVYPAKATALNVISTAFITFLLAGIFSVFPSLRAMKLAPVAAMRQ
jgi:ABC-type lipoprotein release transport system permease subunit